MVKILLGILLVVFSVLGVWYLANPELWNTGNYKLFVGAPSTSTIAPSSANPSLTNTEIQLSNRNRTNVLSEASPRYVCLPNMNKVKEAPTVRHYKWVGENGVINFSDTPPKNGTAEIYDLGTSARPEYFNLKVDFRGRSSVPYLKARLTAQTNGVYEILSDWIGEERLRQVDVNLTVLPDRANYLAYAKRVTGNNMDSTGGFFSTARQEAITYQYPDDKNTFEVARHESVHVILHGILGELPLWLNEGMAEYFEQMSMAGQLTEINVNNEWLMLARNSIESGYPRSLSDYLALSNAQWREDNNHGNVHYALGWSLVYFLTSTPEGRRSLSFVMRELADNYCASNNGINALNQTYPGGFNELQKDFVTWLRTGDQKRSHRY